MTDKDKLYSISDLASEYALTPRTIRFYEDKGLIAPQRIGGNRIYNYRDRARIILILRLKGVGFTLDQIKEYMDLYNADETGITQLKHGFARILERIDAIKEQIDELQANLSELEEIKAEAVKELEQRGVDTSSIFED